MVAFVRRSGYVDACAGTIRERTTVHISKLSENTINSGGIALLGRRNSDSGLDIHSRETEMGSFKPGTRQINESPQTSTTRLENIHKSFENPSEPQNHTQDMNNPTPLPIIVPSIPSILLPLPPSPIPSNDPPHFHPSSSPSPQSPSTPPQ